MMVIIGGSGSGKSEYAENLIEQLGRENGQGLIYIATMQPFDEESKIRIKKHQQMRQDKNFTTLECYTILEQITIPKHSNVLLECMSNLVANEMFSDTGAKENTREAVLRGIENLNCQADKLVVVTNNVFEDGETYDGTTIDYLKVLGEINCRLCSQAEKVIEVVHGIAIRTGGI